MSSQTRKRDSDVGHSKESQIFTTKKKKLQQVAQTYILHQLRKERKSPPAQKRSSTGLEKKESFFQYHLVQCLVLNQHILDLNDPEASPKRPDSKS